jgi:hypothetical protein
MLHFQNKAIQEIKCIIYTFNILCPVYDSEKEKWRILTNKENYASIKKHTIRDNKVK